MLLADGSSKTDALTDWRFWLVVVPGAVVWVWWSRRVEKKRGRPFTDRERWARRIKLRVLTFGVTVLVLFVAWLVRS
ncbi:hypothetical protein [Aeromicrobium terrae]|uniref:Uncharacterized protein n=1 Tax=Aeromicrobium terrae TaxID=2498846 RepID=A0A5C8NF21_9ACTN|nr:hypothetical protein [Aeromicrobium terrae]TXL57571.1 hypothetical protein FHP06_12315 [Aeromicrobium terrae]